MTKGDGGTIDIVLPRLYDKQRKAFFSISRLVKTAGSTKSGKTVGAIAWQLAQCCEYAPGKAHLWLAPIYAQAEVAFQRVCRILRRCDPNEKKWKPNKSDLFITFDNGSRWFFKGSDKPDSIYASDYASAVVDEDSRCKREAWAAVVSTTTATGGPIRCIGNVRGRKNWAYELGQQIQAGKIKSSEYHVITWKDAVDAGTVTLEAVDFARQNLPEHVFNELYNCDPSDDGLNPFGIEAIAACIKPLSTKVPVAFGVDLARSIDFTVVVGLDEDANVCRFERWNKKAIPGDTYWDETEKRLGAIIGNTPASMDVAGIGDVFVERMRRRCPFVEGYNTGSQKQGLMESLAVAIQQRRVGLPDQSPECPLRDELESFEYSLSAVAKKVQYAAPEGLHDDCVVALGLAVNAHDRVTHCGSSAETFSVEVLDAGNDDDRMWTGAGW